MLKYYFVKSKDLYFKPIPYTLIIEDDIMIEIEDRKIEFLTKFTIYNIDVYRVNAPFYRCGDLIMKKVRDKRKNICDWCELFTICSESEFWFSFNYNCGVKDCSTYHLHNVCSKCNDEYKKYKLFSYTESNNFFEVDQL